MVGGAIGESWKISFTAVVTAVTQDDGRAHASGGFIRDGRGTGGVSAVKAKLPDGLPRGGARQSAAVVNVKSTE